MRNFFFNKNFLEVHTQNRLSILAACEDPETIATYELQGIKWPLPQTGQMWLEYELLTNPDYEGVFVISTSYREEPNPIDGRHDIIFPMFEFESKGTMNDLIQLLKDLNLYLGFAKNEGEITTKKYLDVAADLNTQKLSCRDENKINNMYNSPVVLLTDFPENTSPFWNMKRYPGNEITKKVDVIIGGMETMGGFERECDVDVMRNSFYSISNREYAKRLYDQFGASRVKKELENFLSLPMFPRYGAGIGFTRLLKNYKKFVQNKRLK